MNGGVTIRGYIPLRDAARRLAKIPEYAAGDFESLDFADRYDDASEVDKATRRIRRAAANGELTGYHFIGDGKPHRIPEGIWADDEACLVSAGKDRGLEELGHFHPRGLEVDGKRRPVFLAEQEFKKFLEGETKPKASMAPRIQRPRGRPQGSSPVGDGDEIYLQKMDALIEQSLSLQKAADSVVADNWREIWKKSKMTTQASVSARLQRKWMKSRQPKNT